MEADKKSTKTSDWFQQQNQTPLLESKSALSPPIRTGNVWTAVAHIITGVIGSGVLSLAWSVAQLGWIAGPLAMILFAGITLTSAFLLCNCYRSPDPEFGPCRNRSYLDAVDTYLGKRYALACAIFVQSSLYGLGIAYTVTSAISMRSINKSNCQGKEMSGAECKNGDNTYMIIFGVAQIIMSQIPNFHNIEWLSILAAIMSFTYSFIGLGLGISTLIGNGYIKGGIGGVSTSSTGEKVWLVSQALGDIAFAYPYSLILIEIQDTLKSPPPENQTMRRASIISITVTTLFYLCCGGFGYAAFGNGTPGNLLTGFKSHEPHWLIDLADVCIVLHLIGAYQVYSQPLFAHVEKWFSKKYPNSMFINNNYVAKLPLLPAFQLNLLRLCFRTAYVLSTTGIAMTFPFFNQVLGVLGPLNFWPLTIYFPVEMYFAQKNIEPWTTRWIMLRAFTIFGFLVTLFALTGSIEGLVQAKLN